MVNHSDRKRALISDSAPKIQDRSANDAEDDSSDDDENINVNFEFYDPRPQDFHAIKTFLVRLLDGHEFDVSSLADVVCAQTTVGTTIRIDSADDIYGFISVINAQKYATTKWLQQIRDHVLERCPPNFLTRLRRLFDDKQHQLGIVLNERVMNIPPQLVPSLHRALHDEISWATEDEPTQELRDSFKFDNYLILTKVSRDMTSGSREKKRKGGQDERYLFLRVEDEVYFENSSFNFSYDFNDTSPEAALTMHSDMPQQRLLMVVSKDRIPQIRNKLESLAGE